jgi:predicted RNase H-like nuclease
VIFIGVDAAWGEVNETGVVALDPSGHVRRLGLHWSSRG